MGYNYEKTTKIIDKLFNECKDKDKDFLVRDILSAVKDNHWIYYHYWEKFTVYEWINDIVLKVYAEFEDDIDIKEKQYKSLIHFYKFTDYNLIFKEINAHSKLLTEFDMCEIIYDELLLQMLLFKKTNYNKISEINFIVGYFETYDYMFDIERKDELESTNWFEVIMKEIKKENKKTKRFEYIIGDNIKFNYIIGVENET